MVTPKFTGLRAWAIQRAGASYMFLFAIFMLVSLKMHTRHSYVEWKAWVTSTSTSVAFGGFVLALFSHTWVGLRDVLLDYAKPDRLRQSLVLGLALALVCVGVWTLEVLMQARL